MSWLLHFSGVDNGSGRWYLWWSGFGANFQEYALIGAVVLLYRRHNCHVHRCWRVGRYPVEGTGYVVCRAHHPEGPVTAGQVAARHAARGGDIHVHVSGSAADAKAAAQQVVQVLRDHKRRGGGGVL